jgi:hypothetical protein
MGGWSIDLGVVAANDVKDVLRERTGNHRAQWAKDEAHPAQAANVALLAEVLKAGVDAMGGKCHVHAGANFRVEENGDTQNSITMTFTVSTRRPDVPAKAPIPGVVRTEKPEF